MTLCIKLPRGKLDLLSNTVNGLQFIFGEFNFFAIFFQVIKTTGLATGLFDDKELVADNVKEKEPKMAFLQKGIDFVSK